MQSKDNQGRILCSLEDVAVLHPDDDDGKWNKFPGTITIDNNSKI